MNRRLVAGLLLLGAAGIVLVFSLGRSKSDPSKAPDVTVSSPTASNSPATVTIPSNPAAIVVSNPVVAPVAPVASPSLAPAKTVSTPVRSVATPPGIAPAMVLENMRSVIRNYGSRFGGNPVGNNAEITKALDGENPGQAHFISEDSGLRINEKGELVDPWGTPFFFHQLSGKEMEIRSAGPDRKMWTVDDLVTR